MRRGISQSRNLSVRIPHELANKIHIFECGAKSELILIGCAPTAAFYVLIIIEVIAEIRQFCRRFAGVSRVHPVILGGSVKEDFRIAGIGLEKLIGRIFGNIGPLFSDIRVAIFPHPRRAGE